MMYAKLRFEKDGHSGASGFKAGETAYVDGYSEHHAVCVVKPNHHGGNKRIIRFAVADLEQFTINGTVTIIQ